MNIIADGEEISRCQEVVKTVFGKRAAESKVVRIGFPGGSLHGTAHWLPELEVWGSFELEDTRHWNAFGLGNPFDLTNNVPISIEVNPPFDGINRRVQGAFATDEAGTRYLLHRGKIGGTKVNISREDFLGAFRKFGAVREAWDGTTTAEFAVVGIIDEDAFPEQAAAFVRFADSYKRNPGLAGIGTGTIPGYTPEFTESKLIPPRDAVLADCRHGIVVDALRRQHKAGINGWNIDSSILRLVKSKLRWLYLK
jgi:hypothetical protein